MSTTLTRPEPTAAARIARRAPYNQRAAALVFAAWIAVGALILLFVIGDVRWFFRDEWKFLADPDLARPSELLEPHNAHWSTIPKLVYALNWELFGATTYFPYLLWGVVVYLATVVLTRAVMIRSGVNAWIATFTAGLLILFAPGSENAIWGFQIGLSGSLALGLGQLLLADHDGPFDRRDWLGLGCGVLALMTSGIGAVMAVAVGLAVLLRHGWQRALFHTGPLAVLYVGYAAVFESQTESPFGSPTLETMVSWTWNGILSVFVGLGHYRLIALIMAALVVLGVALAWAQWPKKGFTAAARRAALPTALLVSGIAFILVTGWGRWFLGADASRAARYVHPYAVFVLPALALGIDYFVRRWRWAAVPLAAVLLVPLWPNASTFYTWPNYMRTQERVLQDVIRMPFAREVPPDVRPIPDPFGTDLVTIGWLLDAEEKGKLNQPSGPLTELEINEYRIRLGVEQRHDAAASSPCQQFAEPVELQPSEGTEIGFRGSLRVVTTEGDGATSNPVDFVARNGRTLRIELPELHLLVGPAPGARRTILCMEDQ